MIATYRAPLCPDCEHVMQETFEAKGALHFYCPRAIGKAEWDKRFMAHILPEGDPHKRVMAWTTEQLERRGVAWVAREETSRAVDYSAQRRERTQAA